MADLVELEVTQWVQSLPAEQRASAQMSYLSMRKEPTTALGLSFLLFLGISGVGRMYIGQVGYGIAMLVLNWLSCGIWGIIDLFLIHSAAQQYNRSLLMQLRLTIGG